METFLESAGAIGETSIEEMDNLLEQAPQARGKSVLAGRVSSPEEQEILALLHRPATHPLSVEEVRHELLSSFSELQIQTAIINLLKDGTIETVYTQGFRLGLTLASGAL